LHDFTNSPFESAYLAGIIDGEGTIGIYKLNKQHHVRLVITNTNSDLIQWVHQRVGGSVRPTDKRVAHHKQGFQVVAYGREATPILQACWPYLVVKRAQAELALSFQAEYISFRGRRVDDAVLARREAMYLESLALNGGRRRGRPHKK
jgi:hypothetical protein